MKVGDRVAWNPTWDNLGAREGIVIAAPGEAVEASGAFVTLGLEAVAIRFDSPINGTREYIIGTANVEVIS